MKKREVKAFDIKEFNTKEEVIAEIKRIEKLDKADTKRSINLDKGLTVVVLTTFAAGLISFCVSVGSLIGYGSNNSEMNDIAKTMTLLDGYEEVYKEDAATITTKFTNGEISRSQLNKELDKLEEHEYIRSIAPKFCPEHIIDAYDNEKQQSQNRIKLSKSSAGVLGVSCLAFISSLVISDCSAKSYVDRHAEKVNNLSALYYKKEELEEQEKEKTV